MTKDLLAEIKEHFPLKIFFAGLLIWFLLALLNVILFINNYYTGVGILFPFSVIYPNAFLPAGFLFGFIFLLLGFYALKNSKNLSVFYIFLYSFCLILAGNMTQGNADIAFMQPFYFKGRQYYADAVQIADWKSWLRFFNDNLEHFQLHTRTHPPFTTLLHFFTLKIFNGNIMALGVSFFALAFSGIFAFYKSLRLLNFKTEEIKKITLLFAIIPSVNIYSLVSIDGIILALTCYFIYGLLLIIKSKSINYIGLLICTISFFLINSLSFSGLFFAAFIGILGLKLARNNKYQVLILSFLVVFISAILYYLIFKVSGYNHYLTFRHAAQSENPFGFMPFANFKVYFFTRLEDIGEIFFFLSFALLAVVFSKNYFSNWKILEKQLFVSATSALGLMFLTGAYGTGETARACLFIVPFFLFMLKNLPAKTFKWLFILCILQTFAMQLVGNFFW